jgi:hypothetical protein
VEEAKALTSAKAESRKHMQHMKKQKFHLDPDLWRVAGILSLRQRNINKRCGKRQNSDTWYAGRRNKPSVLLQIKVFFLQSYLWFVI